MESPANDGFHQIPNSSLDSSARLALCQYEALILSTGSIRLEDEYSTLRQTRIQLEDGATGITDNLKELIQLKLGTYLPISM